jgi:hypothetical protein
MSFSEFLSFMFINSKINSLLFYLAVGDEDFQPYKITRGIDDAKEAKAIYKKQIRGYLGLGFFLSFIPGTEPFLARKALLSSILNLESLDDIAGGKAIPGFMKNIFTRTLFALLYHYSNTDLATILLKRDDKFAGPNRLNPFLYPTKLFVFTLEMTAPSLQKLFYGIEDLPLILKIPVYASLAVIGSIATIAIVIGLLINFTTELVLNSLNTLLFEPFIFVFEVLQQLVNSWGLDLAYMPAEDYKKVDRLITAIDENLINDVKQNDSLRINTTTDLTLIESTEKVIDTMEKHRNSLFFKVNKDTNLEKIQPATIKNSYNQLELLRKFSYFTHIEMANEFPKELTHNILDTWLKINSKDLVNHAIGLDFIEPDQSKHENYDQSEHEDFEPAKDNPFALNGF